MTRHWTYVLHGESGPLYAGMTVRPTRRLSEHLNARYGPDIRSVTVTRHESKQEAVDAEKALILDLQPPLNLRGKGRRQRSKPTREYLPPWAGPNLRALRQARGIRQSELASALLISTPYLCNIEAGRKRLTPALAAAAADTLGIPPVALIRRDVLDEQAA